jgi:uncharacterized lipoprotein YddW (UPF0748 family)
LTVRPSRRDFLATAAAAGLGWGCARRTPERQPGRVESTGPTLPRSWTWVHGGQDRTPEEWRRRFSRLRDAGFEAVLVSGGSVTMLSDAAREAGLAFHRWTWTLNRSGDAFVKDAHPDWFTVSRRGQSSLSTPPYVGYYQWLCPTKPAVRAYLADRMDEIARDASVDGVHLDYVRHCDVILPVGLWAKYGLVQDHEMPEFDFCYCDTCREIFASETGRDPLDLADPPSDEAWRVFRWRGVTELVTELAARVHDRKKPITAAVFPTPQLARRLVRQAWDLWPIDAVFPMLYHGFYNEDVAWIGRSVREGTSALRPGCALYAGLYLPDLPPDVLGEAMKTALEAGASGFSTFEMNGLTDTHLDAVAKVIHS